MSTINFSDLPVSEPVPILPDYQHHPMYDVSQRPLHVLMAGMGPSGIAMAVELLKMPNITVEIFEKNPDVGGTWFENRYLGAACDIASHAYQYTFNWNPNWSSHFAPSKEIFEYFKQTAEKYKLLEKVQFNSKVCSATWNQASGKWKLGISVNDGERRKEVEGDIFINAGGILNKWTWPDIEGLHDFKGDLVHTANWSSSVKWEGKRVAVIGSGASGVQVVPPLQKMAKHLDVYVRTPTYILPVVGFGSQASSFNEKYSEEFKERLRTDKKHYRGFRKSLEYDLNGNFTGLFKDNKNQKDYRQWAETMMRETLASRPDLQEKLIPRFEIFCRRVTPSLPYLQAVQKDNIEIISVGIKRIVSNGVQTTDGVIHEVDAIICATGFDTSFSPPYDLKGLNGLNLKELWTQKGAESYMGIAVADFPNYWSFLGPNTPIANGSLIPCIEATAKYVRQMLYKIQSEQIKSVNIKPSVQAAFNSYTQAVHKDLVWTGNCKSWYKNKEGRVIGVWPGSSVHFMSLIERPRMEDYEVEYIHGYPFAFMGNGISQKEVNKDDLAWCMCFSKGTDKFIPRLWLTHTTNRS